ncbi:hypothetical protein [Polyangium sp. 15x6]|uniref:hypothetical protein n=1 Tax=Polyangium sp. 15x6 TaxID=3042687 RepID=UPI00249AB631|nr:hypothetical protein [Polyangium sp. 15x6]MDI3282123.1 hypothetical protein [Polyangium sp. 15x6]
MANGPETDTSADSTQGNEPSADDKKLANLVNSAVSAHLKRHLGKLSETIETSLAEKLAGLQQSAPKKADESDPKPDDDLRKELSALKDQLKSEKQKAREKEAYAELKAKLADKVRPEALDTVLKVLKHDGRISLKRDGSVAFLHEDGEMDLDEGLSEWLKSREGSMFAPPPNPRSNAAKKPNYGVKAPARTSSESGEIDPLAKTEMMLTKLGLRL